MIDGLSYADWEDDADRLRQLANGTGRVTKRSLTQTEKLLASLNDEIGAIDSISHTLTGFDAIRVGCVRDLLVAFRISVRETQRLLMSRASKPPRRMQRQKAVA
jgi:hypothetical protein